MRHQVIELHEEAHKAVGDAEPKECVTLEKQHQIDHSSPPGSPGDGEDGMIDGVVRQDVLKVGSL
jgi:hypothetical protein